ncbi:MAG: hypothetical protein KKE44_13545 [Proteobacteria bacterium]|nr:hypothetical protein [Pseudomonadota bacterium]MBU1583750.1 hypothetical protein [Pseudomonadota bacterium]
MSICTVSKVENQIQQYFNNQNTQALAETTKTLYAGVAKTKLVPFCKEKGITVLDKTFIDHMDAYSDYIRDRTSAQTISTRYPHPTAEMLQALMNKASGW